VPHCIVEYSDNLAADGEIAALLEALAGRFRGAGDLFPLAGIRVRAHRVEQYVIADGHPWNGFVHLACRITPGRDPERIAQFFDALFGMVTEHFAPLMANRKIGLSMDVDVSTEGSSRKLQNIVERKA